MNPLPDQSNLEAGDDPRLFRAAQEYLDELEAGRRPGRDSFVAQFPDLAEKLTPYLEALDLVYGAAPALQEPAPRPGGEPPPGEPLGDFRIVREIGRGGMGVVYEAVQMSLGRRVALKVLPFAAALDAKQLGRFRNEARAAAQLHHTNIVPVYAVGCERGVHYYAMQLIEGKNLADLIEQLRSGYPGAGGAGRHAAGRLPGTPQPTGPLTPPPVAPPTPEVADLSTQSGTRSPRFFRTAARLLAQAAEAIEHAHQFGVIHRDVKPANLMVDGHGNVWVTDFGLAQFVSGVGLTRTGDLMGTLRYMSPEQAGGQRLPLDPRTDVYSLGATLYELLTLAPLFDGNDYRTLLAQILHDEPRRPRSLERSVPQELETIVLKAVSKTPADRYASAREFADDLNRFLDDRPILARRPTLTQRVRKWARRHPSVVVAGVVLLALVAAGSLVHNALMRDEQAKTRAAYERERQKAEEAVESLRLARRSVDEMIRIGEEELPDKPQTESARRRLAESALAYYQEFIDQARNDPAARADLLATQGRVKKILDDLAVMQGDRQYFLLSQPAVLDDLHATAEQRTRLEQCETERRDSFRGFGKVPPEERRKRLLAGARDSDAAVRKILDKEQLKRLGQIALQIEGPVALRENEIATALHLSAAQREQIRVIADDCGLLGGPRGGPPDGPPDGHHGGRRGGPPDGERAGDRSRKLREANERVRAALNPEQVRLWQEMTGKPYEGEMAFPMLFGPPGPRGKGF